MSTRPIVEAFFHADSSTWSYVVSDPEGRAAAIIDPVLDFDAASGRTSTTSAEALLDYIDAHALQVAWLLETHAHADHLSASHWLRSIHFPNARIAIGAGITAVQKNFRSIFNLGEHSRLMARNSITSSMMARPLPSAHCKRRSSRCPAIPATAMRF